MKLNNDGVELDKAGDHRAALEKFRAALDIEPTHAKAQESISKVREKMELIK